MTISSLTFSRTWRRALLWPLFGALLALAASSASAKGETAPKELRIGYQKAAINLVVLKSQGTLEKRLPGTKIVWLEFPAGPQILEALAVGSVDLGFTGDSPPVFAQAAGRDVFYVGAERSKPQSSAILAPASSALKQLSDLKGKKIALQKGSSSQFLLFQAVKKAGLTWSDIHPVYLAPADARAAFEQGSVDAWAIWDPYYAAAEQAVHARVLTNGVGLSNNNSFYLASRAFITEHSETILQLFDELTRNDDYIQHHGPEVEALFAAASGLDISAVHIFNTRRHATPTGVITDNLIEDQQKVADSFAQISLIPHPVHVADAVWRPGHPLTPPQPSSR